MPYQHHNSAPGRNRRQSVFTRRCAATCGSLPAPADTGIVFRRVDLDNFEIEAHVDNVARVSYATSLMRQGVLISTTEHLLAALYCCGIDNVYRRARCAGVADSRWIVEAVYRSAGASRDDAPAAASRRYIRVVKPLEFMRWRPPHRHLSRAMNFSVHCFVDYHHPAAGPQEVELTVNRESFSRELAPARTFSFVKDFAGAAENGTDPRRLARERHCDGRPMHSEWSAALSRTNLGVTRRSI